MGPLGPAILLIGLATLPACQRSAPPPPSAPPAVGVIEARLEEINPSIDFVGKLRAYATVELRARIEGFLEERAFAEGTDVEPGALLFRIEPEQYEAGLAQAKAELAAAEARLQRATLERKRFEELRKEQNIAQQQLDNAVAEELAAQAAVQGAQAAVQKAELELGYTTIRAPIDGRTGLASYDAGNLVSPESGVLATIRKLDPIRAEFSLSETWYLELAERAKAAKAEGKVAEEEGAYVPRLRLPDGTLYEHPGEFDFIDPKVDERTGTVLVRAAFPNPDKLLLPGQFVTVVIARAAPEASVVIPQAAVLTDQAGRYVLVVNDEDEVAIRRIETGQRIEGAGRWQIEEGLAPGDRIVIHGLQRVRPGMKVVPKPTEATPPPTEQKMG
jgi:membrane fusion protein (multidrug efflux system)